MVNLKAQLQKMEKPDDAFPGGMNTGNVCVLYMYVPYIHAHKLTYVDRLIIFASMYA